MSRTLRVESITKEQRPGYTHVDVYSVDDSIIIDTYVPSEPTLRWICDHCDEPSAVTAQFKTNERTPIGDPTYITLCRVCLQLAINGIDLSLAKPQADIE